MAVLVRALAILVSVVVVPALASAQTSGAPGPAPGESPPPPSAAPASADADATPAAPAKPAFQATGYSYAGPATPEAAPRAERPRPRAPAANSAGTDAIMAGFETLPDGSTQLFVELSKAVSYDAKSTASTLTVVLKDAKVDRRNNQNPMVTVHFNTPVTSARLVPHGRDVWFVVDLRSSVQPAVTLAGGVSAKDPSAFLRIAFPKGDYLVAPPPPAASTPAAQAARRQASASAAAP